MTLHVCVIVTFLLVLVDVHLPLLLQPQCVDDGHGQAQRLPGVAVGAQGVHAGARRGDVVCGGEVGGAAETSQAAVSLARRRTNKKEDLAIRKRTLAADWMRPDGCVSSAESSH